MRSWDKDGYLRARKEPELHKKSANPLIYFTFRASNTVGVKGRESVSVVDKLLRRAVFLTDYQVNPKAQCIN